MAPSDEDVFAGACRHDASDRLRADRQLYFQQLCIPEFERTVIGHCDKLLLVQFQHLINARVVFLNGLDRLELNAVVGVLNPEYVVILYQLIGFADEIHRLDAELGHHSVDIVFIRVVTQDLNLMVEVIFLVFFKL